MYTYARICLMNMSHAHINPSSRAHELRVVTFNTNGSAGNQAQILESLHREADILCLQEPYWGIYYH